METLSLQNSTFKSQKEWEGGELEKIQALKNWMEDTGKTQAFTPASFFLNHAIILVTVIKWHMFKIKEN